MIIAENLVKKLKKSNINFFTGVPDSILKKLSFCLDDLPKSRHIIATSEGSATSIGIGYHLSTSKIPCVYMQNSGLSNAINPLISIAHKDVYSIPLLLIIGWRGAPNKPDEPQHKAKGKITKEILNLLKIKYCILKSENDFKKMITLIKLAKKNKRIVACLIEKDTLKNKKNYKKKFNNKKLLRYDFLKQFVKLIPKKSFIISTTGYTSRELFELRKINKFNKGKDFYMVGGMGHSSSVSLGFALNNNKKTFCIDGDGSLLMHLGSLRTIGHSINKNFKHILLNNNSHESVGGQITFAEGIDFKKLIFSLGYRNFLSINNKNNIQNSIKRFLKSKGPSFLEVKIKNGSLNQLSRPKNLIQLKEKFMKK